MGSERPKRRAAGEAIHLINYFSAAWNLISGPRNSVKFPKFRQRAVPALGPRRDPDEDPSQGRWFCNEIRWRGVSSAGCQT